MTPDREVVALHPNEPMAPYAFEVHHRIRRDVRDDYARTAQSMEHCAAVVALQFEEGVWGGEDGDWVLDFTESLRLPTVVTFHTVHPKPTPRQREIVQTLAAGAESTVGLSRSAADVLTGVYGIDPARLEVIPYGVPDLPIMAAETIKPTVELAGRDVIVAFGLLGRDKGFEVLIEALPAIVADHPRATLVIVGATHPDVRLRDGETYRDSLKARVAALKLGSHVRFVPEFVGRVELARWLQAADVVVSPSLDRERTGSGTLAHAMGAGRAIVATRSPVSQELLADRHGIVVSPTPAAIAAAIHRLLKDPALRAELGDRAHERSRPMAWTRVGAEYQRLFALAGGRRKSGAGTAVVPAWG
ncbi:MAG TPA: glycosyltransferase [Candidatus Limnocylindria bacterium]|nr:glycosyltransferase [Candidatus Limnocylindria bacterium]